MKKKKKTISQKENPQDVEIGEISFQENFEIEKKEIFALEVALVPLGMEMKNKNIQKIINKEAGMAMTQEYEIIKMATEKKEEKKKGIHKSKEWVILNKNNGEKFVLENLKTLQKAEFDLAVMGLPEGGKKEPWNIIKMKERKGVFLKEGNAVKYILDDYDLNPGSFSKETLHSNIVMPGNKNKVDMVKNPLRKFVASPYVINLKKEEVKEEEKQLRLQREIAKSLEKRIDLPLKKVKGKLKEFWVVLSKERKIVDLNALQQKIVRQGKKGKKAGIFQKSIKTNLNKKVGILIKDDGGGKFQFFTAACAFGTIAFFLILPIYGVKYYLKATNVKGRVLGAATEALENFKEGKNLLEVSSWDNAKGKFAEAQESFQAAENALSEINRSAYNLAFVFLNKEKEVDSLSALIESGKKAAQISAILTDGFYQISQSSKSLNSSFQEMNETTNIASTSSEVWHQNFKADADQGGLLEVITGFHDSLGLALPKINELKDLLGKVDLNVIPEQYKGQLSQIKNSILFVQDKVVDYIRYSEVIRQILAPARPKRYLLVFQNNNEIRPTGGFIGSYALLDIKDGKIKNLEIPAEGPYFLEGTLLENIEPPYAIRLINSRWEFQDSNWWPDFPTAANDMARIYEKSGGPTVDGVIAIDASLMPEILKVIGPIELPSYNKIITADNFIEETQNAVELEYNKMENKPKKIIADLMPQVLDKLFSLVNKREENNGNGELQEDKLMDLLTVFSKSLQARNIQLFAYDKDLEKKIIRLNWGGEIKDISNRDYLAIISTNLGGRKTDGVIDETIRHDTEILEDGTITDELFITKKHNGLKGDYFEGVNSVDYLRVFVPLGSVLLEAQGFDQPPEGAFKEPLKNSTKDDFLSNVQEHEKVDIPSETRVGELFNKTYFANWMQVNPGEEATVRLKYRLPFNIMDSENVGKYSLYLQKQAGSREHMIIKNLHYPKNLQVAWSYPGAPDPEGWVKMDKLENDRFYGVIFKNN